MFSFDVPPRLLRHIARYAREDLLDKLVGLGISPEYQANAARIETLIHIALIEPRGRKRATSIDLAALLNGFEDHAAAHAEDPAEDVFVSAVSMPTGEFRIFNGIYPGADYSLQRLLDAVLAQDFKYRDSLSRECNALLRLSDAVAERCGFAINEFAESTQWRKDWPLRLPVLLSRGAAARFTPADLAQLDINITDLKPFRVTALDGLLDARFGETLLNRWPVIAEGNGVHLPIPSFISPALRLYLAQGIANGVVPRKAIEVFHTYQFTRWMGVDLPLIKAKLMEIAPLHLPEPDLDIPGLTQTVLRFDEDKLMHILVLECTWRDPPERKIHDRKIASTKFQNDLADYLRIVHDKLSDDMGVSRGLTLVIQDSPGWSLNMTLPEDFTEYWYCTGFPARTFSFLLADLAFSLIDLWKMLREIRELEAKGVRMMAWPEMLNYWSIWQALGSTFWLPTVDSRAFGAFMPDTSKIVETMLQIRLASNPHAMPLPSGEWLRVERWLEELSPSQDYSKPIYLNPVSIALGELRSVVETQYGPWWVASARPRFDPQDRQLLYLIWQASAEWLLRIARSSAGRLPASTQQSLEIRLLPVPETIPDAPDDIEFVLAEGIAVVTITLPPLFPDKLMTVDNSGERLLIAALIDGVLTALRQTLPDEVKARWLAEVAADPNLKMIHLTPGGDHGYAADLVAERLPLRFLQQTDMAAAERFMRDALEQIPAAGVPQGTETVSGQAAVRAVLNSAVDVHWSRCKTLLNSLDRELTLVLISRLIEALHRERVSSERGGLARLRHYAESPEYSDLARITMGRRDRAYQAYRIVAEMALCECPLAGGRAPGSTDIDILAAEVATLIEVAHNSDGVERGLIKPELDFRADGAIELVEGGALACIQSYILACLSESIALDVDAYPTLFERDPENIETLLREDDPFLLAFRAELGLDLGQSAEISNALQAIAVDKERDVASIRRSELETLLAKSSSNIDGTALSMFLNAFGLATRSSWETRPGPPYNQSDIWPWLFERRLSLMLRPVLILDKTSDPLLVFGVRQIDMGVRYASTLLETGDWPRDKLLSEAGRAYVDEEGNRRGHAFEALVAEMIRGGSWQALESIPMKRLGAPKQLGDLDVLGVSKDGRRWWVIECKWFGAARTPREIANWLHDFRGRDGDKLDRHLKRLAWICEHRDRVAARLGLAVIPDSIEPKIVTTSPVPLALQKNLPAGSEVLSKRELVELLAISGTS